MIALQPCPRRYVVGACGNGTGTGGADTRAAGTRERAGKQRLALHCLGASQARNVILWDPDPVLSWWWLAQRAPYTVTPLRMLHDLGVAMAVLGVCLLVTRSRRQGRLVRPLAVAGSMALTLYTAHILVLSRVPARGPARGAVRSAGARLPGVRERLEPYGAPGPLEALVSTSCRLARHLVDARPPSRRRS